MANCSMQLAYAEDSAVRLTSALVAAVYYKKPALTRVQRPTPALFLYHMTLTHPLTPKYGFPGLIFEHLCVNYGDPSCVGF